MKTATRFLTFLALVGALALASCGGPKYGCSGSLNDHTHHHGR